jgi:NAD+-dependent secondary alcohol dehydrogenase Adh1
MRAARLHEYDSPLSLDDVPQPDLLGPGDVVVRIGGAGLCRTDLHVIEGIWREKVDVELPYTLGHENAGWVEAVGGGVTTVREGDAVIVHPLVTCGVCAACRRGEDMYCASGSFPGITVDGGFAEYLRTNERALVRLAEGIEPKDVAPYADAGLTAYRAARKAAEILRPGQRVAVIGVGGLGHIALQVLHELCAAEVIAVDRSPLALELARELGAEHVVTGGESAVAEVRELSNGGVEAVLDFVGEAGSPDEGIAMLGRGGTYFVVGYGGHVHVPTIDVIFSEISVVGNLVGNYTELAELMALAAQGRVHLLTQAYGLDEINQAVDDLHHGRIKGRGVIVP